ncbi:MAG TPA: hypothetical protein ENH24_03920 [Nitrospirae bacterium]|nr:hypothetical protein [Nitrospirota bacterium]
MSTIKLKIENLGVNKNKGQGWNAWIKSTDGTYYSKFCNDEEEGKAAIGDLKPGDKVFLKFSVKNGFNNFQSYQKSSLDTTSDKKTETEEAEKTPDKSEVESKRGKESYAALKKEAEELIEKEGVVLRAHYVQSLRMAKEVVDEAIPAEEENKALRKAAMLAVFDKIASPRKYFLDEIRRGR